jgi:SAM-dependent methyltransferase
VAPGQAVLDVGCGTGVVARTAADRMGGRGRVVGLDLNEGMLTVAGRLRPDIEWRQGDAAELPFAPGSFDAVLCQSALMFFPDRVAALRRDGPGGDRRRHRRRPGVGPPRGPGGLRPDGRGLLRAPGPDAMELESAYWALGDLGLVGSLFEAAGLRVTGTRTRVGTVRYPSAAEAVATEIEATPLAERIDRATYERVLAAGTEAMGPFVVDGGRVELPIGGHLVTGATVG